MSDFFRVCAQDYFFKLGTKQGGGFERSVRGEIIVVEAIQRTRDMAGHRIDRLLLAAIADRSTSVEEGCLAQIFFYERNIDREPRIGLSFI